MLPDIKGLKMEAESSKLSQQWIDKGLRQPLAAILHQARPHHDQIGFKLRRVLIRTLNVRAFAAALQPVEHVGKKTPVKLRDIARSPEHGGSGQRTLILRQPRDNLR